MNNKIFYTSSLKNGNELWMSDGTSSGTQLIELNPGSAYSSPSSFTMSPDGTKVFFRATTGANGTELWVSDGTISGTKLVKDITTGTDSTSFTFYGFIENDLFFKAGSSQLWVSDGIAETTTGAQGSSQYTSDDLNASYQKGVNDTKIACAADPSICGLSSYTAPLSPTMVDALPSGWNLIGSSMPIANMTPFANVDTVWYYDNTSAKWKVYSNNQAIKQAIEQSNYVLPLNELESYSGFWIFK